jgi:hypothetical protein
MNNEFVKVHNELKAVRLRATLQWTQEQSIFEILQIVKESCTVQCFMLMIREECSCLLIERTVSCNGSYAPIYTHVSKKCLKYMFCQTYYINRPKHKNYESVTMSNRTPQLTD